MAVQGKWYIGTDNMVHLQNLKNEDGAFINNATSVTGSFVNSKKEPVVGVAPITFIFKGGSTTGEYDGVVPVPDAVKEDIELWLLIVVIAAGRKFTGRIKLKTHYADL
jgi:hypothetical protein